MPKILRIINRLNLGGPTFNVALLSKYLKPEFETQIVAGMKDETEASSEFILDKMGLKPRYIPNMYRSIHPTKDFAAYQDIKKIIQEYKPDIVHTHAAKSGTLGRLAAKECGVPVIVHTFHGHVFHSYFGPLKTRLYLEIERYLAKFSSKIVAISPEQKKELSEDYQVCNPNHIEVVPLGFDLSKFQENQIDKRIDFRQKYQIADNEVAIAIVGRLVPIKNHSLFLNALKELLNKSTQKIRAFIVGDGEERTNMENLATELNIPFATPENFHKAPLTFTSWITDVDEVYAGADVVALSSLNEGTPVSLIEAQAANKPIVTTNVGGVKDVVIPNQTALLSPSKCVESFAHNLQQLVEDSTLRSQMGQDGYEYVAQKYSYQRLTDDMAQLYDKLLWEHSPAHRKIYSVSAAPSSMTMAKNNTMTPSLALETLTVSAKRGGDFRR
ncbi:MAG: glycosyltransferase family 4 protein [Chitinophagales bacterium]